MKQSKSMRRVSLQSIIRSRALFVALLLCPAGLLAGCGGGAATGAVVGAVVGAAIGDSIDDDQCYDDCYYYKAGPAEYDAPAH